jgi:hypothetical protein
VIPRDEHPGAGAGVRTHFAGGARRRRRRLVRWAGSIAVLTIAAMAGSDRGGLDARSDLTAAVAGGEVVLDSAAASMPPWLTDSNVVALVDSMQRMTIAAARYQLQSWASDSTVNLALLLVRDHSAMLISIDSVAAARRIVAKRPAVSDSLLAPYALQVTSLYGLWNVDREKRFLATQRDAHARAVTDLTALAAVARDPELSAVLGRALQLERDHLARFAISEVPVPPRPTQPARAPGASAGDTTYRR